jgi:hypothetical protein
VPDGLPATHAAENHRPRAVEDARQRPELVAIFATPGEQGIVERVLLLDVVSFDWNSPQYITPRYTPAEIQAPVWALKHRIAELESQLDG